MKGTVEPDGLLPASRPSYQDTQDGTGDQHQHPHNYAGRSQDPGVACERDPGRIVIGTLVLAWTPVRSR